MGETIDKLFLSYVEEDSRTATLIYYALKRSKGIAVWGYKQDGQIGVNFEEEFQQQIHESRYFCLLDSPHSRASVWIPGECQLAKASGATMIVCVLPPSTEEAWRHGTELFLGHNSFRGIAMADYGAGIRELFKLLGLVYAEASTAPREQDLAKELAVARQLEGKPEWTQKILDLYREVRERSGDADFAEAQLRVIIKQCALYGADNVVSPTLALAVLYADAGRHREAARVFSGLTQSHPRDPRGWAGLGAACFHLGEYQRCQQALRQAQEVGLAYYESDTGPHIVEITHNIASLCILLGRHEDAQRSLAKLSKADQERSFIQALKGRLLLQLGEPRKALPLLRAAHEKHDDAATALTIDLANCYRDLRMINEETALLERAVLEWRGYPEIWHRAADSYLRRGKVEDAIEAMRKAASLSADSPCFRAQLAALLYNAGRKDEAVEEAGQCTRLASPTGQGRYYLGLAYYVLGRTSVADELLDECRSDPAVANWPSYSATFGHKPPPRRAAKAMSRSSSPW
jgi:Flp pilus assembly protein TadD